MIDTIARLRHDLALVGKHWRGETVLCDADTHEVQFEGVLRLIEEATCQPTDVRLRAVLPCGYPHSEPKAFDVDGRFKATPGRKRADRHINGDASFCLWLEPLSRWDSSNTDAMDVWLERVAAFCEDQLVYEATGKFPRGEWAHGDAAYAELLLQDLGGEAAVLDRFCARGIGRLPNRNDPCFCEGGEKYKRCHMHAVGAVRRKIGDAYVARGIEAWLAGEHGNTIKR